MNNIEKIPVHANGIEYLLTQEEYDKYRAICTNRVEFILKPMIETFLSGGVACEGDDYPMEFDDIVGSAKSIEINAIYDLLHDFPEVHMTDIEGYEDCAEDEDTIRELAELVGIRYIGINDIHPGEPLDVAEVKEENRSIEYEALAGAAEYLIGKGFI